MGITPEVCAGTELSELMDAMAQNDAAALFVFIDEFGPQLAATVRSILGSVGRRDANRCPTDVEFLVLSAGLVIYDRAAGWDCDGAVPWLWAYRAIRAEVIGWLGHPRVEFISEFHGPRSADRQPVCADVTFRDLAAHRADIAEWITVVEGLTTERNANVHIEYQTQKSLGDPSPAHTVGREFGLRPANVRQIDRRVRSKLAKLQGVTSNPVLTFLTQ